MSTVRGVLDRDLGGVLRQLEAYPDDAAVWREVPGVTNTAGTLALHLAGNIRHFVGTVLGGTDYVRDRDAEFSRRGVPRGDLAAEVERAREEVREVLERLAADGLAPEDRYPIARVTVTAPDLLVHLAAHLAYHLGQMDYHRRAVTGSAAPAGAMAPAELPSAERG